MASKARDLNQMLDYLEVFQVCDSTFPIGTFNHSYGMENYLFTNRIKRAPEFAIWFKNFYRSQFKYGEGLLTQLAYQAIEAGQFEKLLTYDDQLTKSTLALETRNGTKLIAKQMIILVQKIYGDQVPMLAEYDQAIKEGRAYGNPAIVFTMFAHFKKISAMETFLMYGHSVGSTLVQNAVRSIPLGQRQGQVILYEIIRLLGKLYDQVQQLDASYLGANAPGLELAQINHETQNSRLFMS